MKKIIPILILTISSCGRVSEGKNYNDPINHYSESKSKFPILNFSHFPQTIESDKYKIITKKEYRDNDIEFILYESNLSSSKIDSLSRYISSIKILGHYRAGDNCLLVLNSLPKDLCLDSLEFENKLKGYLNNPCLDDKLPIPKFEDYTESVSLEPKVNLDPEYDIYVLSIGHNELSKEIEIPNMRMPEKWKNGTSSGIAFNRKRREVIYWSVAW